MSFSRATITAMNGSSLRNQTAGGIQIVVFGSSLSEPEVRRCTNSARHVRTAKFARVSGRMKLMLRADDYVWQFIPVSGSSGDTGVARCH